MITEHNADFNLQSEESVRQLVKLIEESSDDNTVIKIDSDPGLRTVARLLRDSPILKAKNVRFKKDRRIVKNSCSYAFK